MNWLFAALHRGPRLVLESFAGLAAANRKAAELIATLVGKR